MATATANKPIGSVFAVRSLLLLLLLNVTPVISSVNIYHKKLALNLINSYRSAAFPPASDMRYMTWSEDLQKEAQELANKCEPTLSKPGLIYFKTSLPVAVNRMLASILQQGSLAIEDGRCKSNETHLPLPCRFFRDLTEAGADRIGCGDAVECPNIHVGRLHYCVTNARSSNEPFTDLVYTKGTPCQRCPKSAGYCYRNLCVSHATKTAIQAETPSAVITCDAPCVNCEERKEAKNFCFCQSPDGHNTEVGSGGLPCSACHLAGTPCRNGGREVGGPSGHCRCLCDSDYGGQFCEMPVAQIVGGVVTSIGQDHSSVLLLDVLDKATAELTNGMANEINLFCRKNQASYLECCGSGTLPTNGPIDFVDASSVHVTCSPMATFPLDIFQGRCTIYATAKGNNGLCRKRTSIPAPTLAVPPDVVKRVYNDKYFGKALYNLTYFFTEVIDFYPDHFNVSVPTMHYISLRVG